MPSMRVSHKQRQLIAQLSVRLYVWCPTCGAEPPHKCVTAQGSDKLRPHPARVSAREKQLAAAGELSSFVYPS